MGNQYATKKEFGGARISLARRVLVMTPAGHLVVGDVFDIDEDRDEPVIRVFGSDYDYRGKLSFWFCADEEALGQMPRSTWTWPPIAHRRDRGPALSYTGNTA